jgi:isoleucyl-tRNA synthetase
MISPPCSSTSARTASIATRPTELKRRAYRTVLDEVFHALVRWLSPVLCFTTEEVWASRYPDAQSIHLETWPEIDPRLAGRRARREVGAPARAAHARHRGDRTAAAGKGHPLQPGAEVELTLPDAELANAVSSVDFKELCIVSELALQAGEQDGVAVTRTARDKCGRCWRHLPEVTEDGALCARCDEVVNG